MTYTVIDPGFFKNLAQGEQPQYLWIGCSDSHVFSNEITGAQPGDIFIHKNIANMVVHTDMNLLSVLSYGVEILKIKHIIVCGHYNCGGIRAAMGNKQYGLIDNWLSHIKDVYMKHYNELDAIIDVDLRARRLVELNVKAQVDNLGKTSIVQNAWKKKLPLDIHGWVYDMKDKAINDLNVTCTGAEELHTVYHFEK